MAELKMKENQYEEYDADLTSESKLYHEIQRPTIINVPTSPATKYVKIKSYEKALFFGLIVAIVLLALATITIRTQISSSENEIAAIQGSINIKKAKRLELQQEKNDLLKTERIQKVAEEKGLSINDDNIRNVK